MTIVMLVLCGALWYFIGRHDRKVAEENSHTTSFAEDDIRKIIAEAFPETTFSEEEISQVIRTSSGHFGAKDIIMAMARIVLLEREAHK